VARSPFPFGTLGQLAPLRPFDDGSSDSWLDDLYGGWGQTADPAATTLSPRERWLKEQYERWGTPPVDAQTPEPEPFLSVFEPIAPRPRRPSVIDTPPPLEPPAQPEPPPPPKPVDFQTALGLKEDNPAHMDLLRRLLAEMDKEGREKRGLPTTTATAKTGGTTPEEPEAPPVKNWYDLAPKGRPATPLPNMASGSEFPDLTPKRGDITLPRGDRPLPSAAERTPLTREEEAQFQQWYASRAKKLNLNPDPDAPDQFYDYRGAFKHRIEPDAEGHWPDTFKQHGHETFSQESIYSRGEDDGGTWRGDTFVPAPMKARVQSPGAAERQRPTGTLELSPAPPDPSTGKKPPFDWYDAAKKILTTKEGVTKLPYVGSVATAGQAYQVIAAARRYSDGEQTEDDVRVLEEYAAEQRELAERGTTWGHTVVGIMAEIPGFAAEMATTMGVFGGVRAGAKKATEEVAAKVTAKWLKETVEAAAERRAVRWAGNVAATATGAIAQQAAMPQRTIAAAIERQQPPSHPRLTEAEQTAVHAATAAIEPLKAQYDPLRAEYEAAKTQAEPAIAELTTLRAQMEQARAQVDPANPASVAAFNAQVQAYNARTQQLEGALQPLSALAKRMEPLEAQMRPHALVLEKANQKTLRDTLQDAWDDDFASAFAKAYPDQFVEIFTEHAGGLAEHGAAAAGKWLSKTTAGQRIAALKAAALAKWLTVNPDNTVGQFASRIAKETGWNGILGEMSEEWLGDVMRGVQPYLRQPGEDARPLIRMATGERVADAPKDENARWRAVKDFAYEQTQMAVAFAAPGLVRHGAEVGLSAVDKARITKQRNLILTNLFGSADDPSIDQLLSKRQELQVERQRLTKPEDVQFAQIKLGVLDQFIQEKLRPAGVEGPAAIPGPGPGRPDPLSAVPRTGAQGATTRWQQPFVQPPTVEEVYPEPPPDVDLSGMDPRVSSQAPPPPPGLMPVSDPGLGPQASTTPGWDPSAPPPPKAPPPALVRAIATVEAEIDARRQRGQSTDSLEGILAEYQAQLNPITAPPGPEAPPPPPPLPIPGEPVVSAQQAAQAPLPTEAPPTEAPPMEPGAPPAGVGFVITAAQRQQLYDLGYSRADVDGMIPDDAHTIIQAGRRSPTAPTVPPQSRPPEPLPNPVQPPAPPVQAPRATPPLPGWMGQLAPELHEPVFAVMRRIDEQAQMHHDEARKLTPPHGTIGVGMADKHAFQQGEARSEFLRVLRRGATPQEAGEAAKTMARLIADKANAQRPRDVHSHLAGGAVDTAIEDAVRAVTRATRPAEAAAAPEPTAPVGPDVEIASGIAQEIDKATAPGPKWKPGSSFDTPDTPAEQMLAETRDAQIDRRKEIAQLEAHIETLPPGQDRHFAKADLKELQREFDDVWDTIDAHMDGIDLKALKQEVEDAALAPAAETKPEPEPAKPEPETDEDNLERERAALLAAMGETEAEPEATSEPTRGRGARRIASAATSALEAALSPKARTGLVAMFKSYTRAWDLRHIREAMEIYERLRDMEGDAPAKAATQLREATEAFFLNETREHAQAVDAAAHAGLQLITGEEDPDPAALLESEVFASAQEAGQLVFETLDPKTATFDIEEFNTAFGEVEWRRDGTTVFPAPTDAVNLWKGRPYKRGEQWVGLGLRDGTSVLMHQQGVQQIAKWKAAAKAAATPENARKVVLSLYDRTGIIAQPWADAGYSVRRFDIRPTEDGGTAEDLTDFGAWMAEIEQIIAQGYTIVGVLAQPPCTSFTSSGSQHWPDKHDAPNHEWLVRTYGEKAAEHFDTPTDYANTLVAVVKLIVAQANPRFYLLENPVGRIAELNGLPDPTLKFHPDDFGEPYTKATQLWGEFNTDLPTARVGGLKPEGGEGSRTWNLSSADKDERAQTAEGFAYAFFMANQQLAQEAWDNQERPPAEEPELGQKYEAPGVEPEAEPAAPAPAPEPTVIAFRSGNQSAVTDVVGFIKAGQDVGVTALGMTKPVRDAIVQHVAGGGNAFIDSGAFGKTEIINGTGVPKINFKAVMAAYRKLAADVVVAGGTAGNLYVVAPDVAPAFVHPSDPNTVVPRGTKGSYPRSFPEETKAIQEAYGPQIGAALDAGLTVIVPVQIGPNTTSRAIEVVREFPGAMIGLPGNQAAISDEHFADMLTAMAERNVEPYGFHFLGIGEENKRFKTLVDMVHGTFPEAIITTDASRANALFGTTAAGTPRKGTDAAEEIIDTQARAQVEADDADHELLITLYDGNLGEFTADEIGQLLKATRADSIDALQQWIADDTLDEHAGDSRIIEGVIFQIAYDRARRDIDPKAVRGEAIARVDAKNTQERNAVVEQIVTHTQKRTLTNAPTDAAERKAWMQRQRRNDAEFRRFLRSLSDDDLEAEAAFYLKEDKGKGGDWAETDAGLVKTFTFANTGARDAFIRDLNAHAKAVNHDPTLDQTDPLAVTVTYVTHDAGDTITEKDRAGAREADRLAEGGSNAVQEPGAAAGPVREGPGTREEVREGDAEGREAPGAGAPQTEAVEEPVTSQPPVSRPVTKAKRGERLVDYARLDEGGDIKKAYSADVLSETGKVRGIVEFNDKQWINVGGMSGAWGSVLQANLIRVVPAAEYKGTTRPATKYGRNSDPGTVITYRGKPFVVTNEKITLRSDDATRPPIDLSRYAVHALETLLRDIKAGDRDIPAELTSEKVRAAIARERTRLKAERGPVEEPTEAPVEAPAPEPAPPVAPPREKATKKAKAIPKTDPLVLEQTIAAMHVATDLAKGKQWVPITDSARRGAINNVLNQSDILHRNKSAWHVESIKRGKKAGRSVVHLTVRTYDIKTGKPHVDAGELYTFAVPADFTLPTTLMTPAAREAAEQTRREQARQDQLAREEADAQAGARTAAQTAIEAGHQPLTRETPVGARVINHLTGETGTVDAQDPEFGPTVDGQRLGAPDSDDTWGAYSVRAGYSVAALQDAFRLTEAEAHAADIVRQQLQIQPEDLDVVTDGEPGEGALRQPERVASAKPVSRVLYQQNRDLAAPIRERISLEADKRQLKRLLGPAMYEKPILEVATKELVQNAFDAVKDAGASEANPGRITITLDQQQRALTITDDGIGMTPDIIKKAFFTIGGTHKEGRPENTSGGLGLAKMAFLLGSDRVRLETTREGVTSTVEATSDEIDNDQIDVETVRTGKPSGTAVTVWIPKSFVDANGETHSIHLPPKPYFLEEPLVGPVEVTFNGEPLDLGARMQDYRKENEFIFDWGTIHVYVDPKRERYPNVRVLSAGLFQFRHYPYDDDPLPYNVLLDVRPKVRTTNPAYPFNNQREGFRSTIKDDVKAMNVFMNRMALEQTLLNAKGSFEQLRKMPTIDIDEQWTDEELEDLAEQLSRRRPATPGDTKKVSQVHFTPQTITFTYSDASTEEVEREKYVDRSFRAKREVDFEAVGIDTSAMDPTAPLFHNNTTAELDDIEGGPALFAELGNTVLNVMREWGEKVGGDYADLTDTSPTGWFGGISVDKGYRGLNMTKPFNAIWINPTMLSDEAMESPEGAASELLHLIIHEITHVEERSEGASFTAELATNYGRLRTSGIRVEFFEHTLLKILRARWPAMVTAHERVNHYDTNNRAESFQSSASAGTGREAPGRADADSSAVDADRVSQDGEQGRGGDRGAAAADPSAGPIGPILAGRTRVAPQRLYQRTQRRTPTVKRRQPKSLIGRITAQGAVQTIPFYDDERDANAESHLKEFGLSGGRFRWNANNGGTVQWSDMPTLDGIFAVEDALVREGLPVAQHVTMTGERIQHPALDKDKPIYQGAQGATTFAADGQAIIHGFEGANVSTAVHELFHVARRRRLNRALPAELRGGITDADLDTFEKWAGAKDGQWTVDAEEKAARGFERYLRDGGMTFDNKAVQKVFDAIKQWMVSLYMQLEGSALDIQITPEVRAIFDKLVDAEIRTALKRETKVVPPASRPAKPLAIPQPAVAANRQVFKSRSLDDAVLKIEALVTRDGKERWMRLSQATPGGDGGTFEVFLTQPASGRFMHVTRHAVEDVTLAEPAAAAETTAATPSIETVIADQRTQMQRTGVASHDGVTVSLQRADPNAQYRVEVIRDGDRTELEQEYAYQGNAINAAMGELFGTDWDAWWAKNKPNPVEGEGKLAAIDEKIAAIDAENDALLKALAKEASRVGTGTVFDPKMLDIVRKLITNYLRRGALKLQKVTYEQAAYWFNDDFMKFKVPNTDRLFARAWPVAVAMEQGQTFDEAMASTEDAWQALPSVADAVKAYTQAGGPDAGRQTGEAGPERDRPGLGAKPRRGGLQPVRRGGAGPLGALPTEAGGAAAGAGAVEAGGGDTPGGAPATVPGGGDTGADGAPSAPGGGTVSGGGLPPTRGGTAGPLGITGHRPDDYQLTPERIAGIINRTKIVRFTDNVAALRLVRDLQADSRYPTPAEQEILAKYVGWGASEFQEYLEERPRYGWSKNEQALWDELRALTTPEQRKGMNASAPNAHYTFDLYRPIWNALEWFGFTGGRVLEPAVGTGHALGFMDPTIRQTSTITATELDPTTAAIASYLYPSANIRATGYEAILLARGTQDLAISNVPFGKFDAHDPYFSGAQRFLREKIHSYFFAKALEHVRPGGYIVFVTSRTTMDGPEHREIRNYLMSKAHFVGAVRLPGGERGAFVEGARTQVVTDVVVLQKFVEGETAARNGDLFISAPRLDALSRPATKDAQGKTTQAADNVYRSSWYTAHPEYLLGTEAMTGKMRRGQEYTVERTAGDLHSQLEQALKTILPENGYQPATTTSLTPEALLAEGAFKPGEFRIGAKRNTVQTVGRNGELQDATPRKRDGSVDEDKVKRIISQVRIRDARRTLIAAMRNPATTDDAIVDLRAELQRVYDAFHDKHGRLNDRENIGAFKLDPDAPAVRELEVTKLVAKPVTDKNGKKRIPLAFEFQKLADIFTQRTVRPTPPITHADTAQDALLTSLSTRAKIDWAYMVSLMGDGTVTPEKIARLQLALKDEGHVFEQPDGSWVLREEYLSGDVVAKLADAEAAAADEPAIVSEGPAARRGRYQGNIESLQAVQPTRKTIKDIQSREVQIALGVHWVDPDDVAQFVDEELRTVGTSARLDGAEQVARWTMTYPPEVVQAGDEHRWRVVYGNPEKPRVYGFTRMVTDALNLKIPDLGYSVKNPDGTTTRYPQPEKSKLALANIQEVRALWMRWVAKDPARSQRILDIYNNRYNRIAPRRFDGSHLATYRNTKGEYVKNEKGVTFGSEDAGAERTTALPGLSLPFGLYKHQLNAVWRILTTGNTLLAHEVGAGKTFEMIIAAMEMRRTGRARKPMITVPTHLLQSWRRDILDAYPTAKVLAFDEDDLQGQAREQAMSRISNGDWDIVLVPHSSFKLMSVSAKRQEQVLRRWVDEILALEESMRQELGAKHPTVKRLEERRRSLETLIAKILDKAKGRDKATEWEDLGVDALFVDEAQAFKNLYFYTKLSRIRGLSHATSDTALGMYIKIQDINESSNYRNLVFATATPVMNTLAEVYTMQRYLQPQRLRELGFANFDNWYATFAEAHQVIEQRPDGSYHEVMRVSDFRNTKLLSRIALEMMDYVGWPDMPYLKLPTFKGGGMEVVQIERHPIYDTLQDWFSERLAAVKATPPHVHPTTGEYIAPNRFHPITKDQMFKEDGSPKKDNILTIMHDAKLAAIDPRLVLGEFVEDVPTSRLQTLAQRVADYYLRELPNKGVALVFLDVGVPKAHEIKPMAFLQGAAAEEDETSKRLGFVEEPDVEGGDEGEGETPSEEEAAFNLYEALRQALIKRGVKPSEIVFIHQAPKTAHRLALFEALRTGQVRVLIASSEKGATGMNIQDRLGFVAEFDAPFKGRPGDIRQRLGRAIRKGNRYEEVEGLRFVTKETTDEWLYGLLLDKDKMITQFMRGNLIEMHDEDAVPKSLEEARVRATGDPRRIELLNLKTQLPRHEAQAANDEANLVSAKYEADFWRGMLPAERAALERITAWVRDHFRSLAGPAFAMQTFTPPAAVRIPASGTPTHTNRAAANTALIAALKPLADQALALDRFGSNDIPSARVAEVRGLPVLARPVVDRHSGQSRVMIYLDADAAGEGEIYATDLPVGLNGQPTGTFGEGRNVVASIQDRYQGLEGKVETLTARIAENEARVARAEETIAAGNEFAEKVRETRIRIAQLEAELLVDSKRREEEAKQRNAQATAARQHGPQASMGDYADMAPQDPAGPGGTGTDDSTVRPIFTPELVTLAKMLIGVPPQVVTRFRKEGTRGQFIPQGKRGTIKVLASLFQRGQEWQLAATIAHEIGHVIDWLPNWMLERGNLLGHLRSLQNFGTTTYISKDGTEIRDPEVRAELKALSAKWRPWDRASSPKSFREYRDSAIELYADALSVILNNPELAKADAPIFYAQFLENLDEKPEVKTALNTIWALMSGTPEELVRRRREGYQGMFREANIKAVNLFRLQLNERKVLRRNVREHIEQIAQAQIDKHWPFVARVHRDKLAGAQIAPEDNPFLALSERSYRLAGQFKAWTEQYLQPILNDLLTHNLSWDLFGEVLAYERITKGDRGGKVGPSIANPNGISALHAQQMLDAIKDGLTKEQWNVLQKSVINFRGAVKLVAADAYGAGLYTNETWDSIAANPAYVTFHVIEHLEDPISSKIYRQIGTLKGIRNPADATLLKVAVTMRAAEHNRVKATSIRYLKEYHPDEAPDAKIKPNTQGKEFQDPPIGKELITYLVNGKVQGVYVSKSIAQSLNNYSLFRDGLGVHVARAANDFLKRIYTTYNPGFQVRNVLRDFFRYWKNMPATETWVKVKDDASGKTRVGVMKRMTIPRAVAGYWRARHVAAVRAFGKASPQASLLRKAYRFMRHGGAEFVDKPTPAEEQAAKDLIEMEKAGILALPFNASRERDVDAAMINNILIAAGVGPTQVLGHYSMEIADAALTDAEREKLKPNAFVQRLEQVRQWTQDTPAVKTSLDFADRELNFLKGWRDIGDFIETLPKAAATYAFKGDGEIADIPADQRQIIRAQVGSPDYQAGGTWKPLMNNAFIFLNPTIQSIVADVRVMRDPATQKSYAWKTIAENLAVKTFYMGAIMAAAAAAAGGGGDDEEDPNAWWITKQLPRDMQRLVRRGARNPMLVGLGRMLMKIPEYTLTNFNVIPLWTDEKGNTVAIRVAQDDMGRMIAGVWWKAMKLMQGDVNYWKAFYDLMDYTGAQFPSPSPYLAMAEAFGEYITGNNVRDQYRQRDLYTPQEVLARPNDTDYSQLWKLMGYEFQLVGGGIFTRFYYGNERPEQRTPGQAFLELPVITSFLRDIIVTKYGEEERFRNAGMDFASKEAAKGLEENRAIQAAVAAYQQRPASERTLYTQNEIGEQLAAKLYPNEPDAEERKKHQSRIRGKVKLSVLKGKADTLSGPVLAARDNDVKAEIIAKARPYYTADEFEKWLDIATQEKIISMEVRHKVRAKLYQPATVH